MVVLGGGGIFYERGTPVALEPFSAEHPDKAPRSERESSFIDNLLVRIHLIIVMISVDRPCAMGV
jgi:hypothetical protein